MQQDPKYTAVKAVLYSAGRLIPGGFSVRLSEVGILRRFSTG